MLSIIEKYHVSTLCEPDTVRIERTKECFKETVRRILEENTELIGHIRTGYMGEGRPRTIELHEYSIPVCRLAWKIVGERDALDQFFNEWKRIDSNPCRTFRVERFCPWTEYVKAITIGKEENVYE